MIDNNDSEQDVCDNNDECYDNSDQLNFCRNEEWDYFLYDKSNNNENNAYLEKNNSNECMEPDNDSNLYTFNKANQSPQPYQKQLMLPEQLEYRLQDPNDIIFPVEQVNSLYYNKPILKAKIASKVKKKMTKTYQAYKHPSKPIKKTKIAKSKQPTKSDLKQPYHSLFRLNPSLNAKGLFDPVLKVHELDNPSRTEKQRKDRLEKIKNYEIRYGKKIKKVELYKNYFDAYEDIENMKNEIDVKRHKYTRAQLKEKEEIQNFMVDITKNQVRPRNLEFNFTKYENKIQLLEQEIENERKIRINTNKKYKKILDACVEEEEIAKRKINSSSIKLKKKMKSKTRRSQTPMRYRALKRGNMLGYQRMTIARRNHSAGLSRHKQKESIRNQTEARIKAQAKLIAKEPLDMIDKDIDALCKDILVRQKKTPKPPKNNNIAHSYKNANVFSKSNSQNSHKNTSSNSQQQQVPQIPYQDSINLPIQNINNYIAFPNNSIIESSIANEIFNNQNNTNTINTINKMSILSNINHSIENYSKGLPQLLDKVTKTINQINQANIYNEITHPIIKKATKSSGQITQLHIDEIIKGIIDTLTIELVNDLQSIEQQKNKTDRKENFALFISDYFNHYKELCSIEDDVSQKLVYRSKRGPLSPYIPIAKASNGDYSNIHIEVPSEKGNDFFMEKYPQSSIENMILHANEGRIKRKEERTYRTALPQAISDNCNDYVKEYIRQDALNKVYIIPNEQALYDEFVHEKINKIMQEEIDKYVDQLDDCATNLFKEEINQ